MENGKQQHQENKKKKNSSFSSEVKVGEHKHKRKVLLLILILRLWSFILCNILKGKLYAGGELKQCWLYGRGTEPIYHISADIEIE